MSHEHTFALVLSYYDYANLRWQCKQGSDKKSFKLQKLEKTLIIYEQVSLSREQASLTDFLAYLYFYFDSKIFRVKIFIIFLREFQTNFKRYVCEK